MKVKGRDEEEEDERTWRINNREKIYKNEESEEGESERTGR